jgi:hypothetical protein
MEEKYIYSYIIFLHKSDDALMKFFYFSFKKNGLRTRNKHYFIFSIDNLNNLTTKMINKETLKKISKRDEWAVELNELPQRPNEAARYEIKAAAVLAQARAVPRRLKSAARPTRTTGREKPTPRAEPYPSLSTLDRPHEIYS